MIYGFRILVGVHWAYKGFIVQPSLDVKRTILHLLEIRTQRRKDVGAFLLYQMLFARVLCLIKCEHQIILKH